VKRYGERRLLSELRDKGWKLGSIDSLLKRSRKTGTILSSYQAVADRVRRVAVEDLVSLADKQPYRLLLFFYKPSVK